MRLLAECLILSFTGMNRHPAGRIGEAPSALSTSLRTAGLATSRLQTGTPARLLKSTIAFENLECQEGDAVPAPFSFMNETVSNAVRDLDSSGLKRPLILVAHRTTKYSATERERHLRRTISSAAVCT